MMVYMLMGGSNKNVVMLHGEYRVQRCPKSGVETASGGDGLTLNACGHIPCVGTTRMDT
jgi:NAD-dependent SIR2 family protein deacetylase